MALIFAESLRGTEEDCLPDGSSILELLMGARRAHTREDFTWISQGR